MNALVNLIPHSIGSIIEREYLSSTQNDSHSIHTVTLQADKEANQFVTAVTTKWGAKEKKG